jgi:outer membrane receptor protein involved in Fe transport
MEGTPLRKFDQYRFGLVASACGAALLLGHPAMAQTAAPQVTEVGEIVVTAQKREEKLRDVPASISVVSGEQLERTGAKSLADFATYVPGFTVNSGGTPGQTTVILRGITTGGIGGALVGTYLDDTPVGSSARFARPSSFALDLLPYDMDRLEVLRGPQGTLYGASTMGGLLKYVLKAADPNAVEARAGAVLESTASTGRLTSGVRGAVNLPLVDGKLAVRASGFYQDNAGWIENAGLGVKNENRSIQEGGRAALFWQAADNLEIKASAMFQNIDSDGNAAVQIDAATLQPNLGRYTRSTQLPEPYNQKLRYYSLTADWDVGFATVTSATSLSRNQNRVLVDQSSLYGPLFPALDPSAPSDGLSDFLLNIRLKKFTQELRIASPSGQKLEWLVGGFFTDEDVQNEQEVRALDSSGAPIASLTPFATVHWPSAYREYAAFGNLTYKFTDRFDVTGGLRYSRNKQDYDQQVDGVLFGGPGRREAVSKDEVTTWSLSARFHPDALSTLYARAASGYRPGGPNVALPGVPPSFASDTLINYETGYKALLLDGRLDLDLAAFYIDWKDIQISVVRNGVAFPGNGGKASSRGLEASGSYRLTPGLRLSANGSYTKAQLDEDVPTLFGVKGDWLPEAPRWTGALSLDYRRPLENGKELTVGAAYRYRGKSYFASETDLDAYKIGAQNIVDAYAGLEVGAVTARLYARNLFNDRSYSTLFDINNPALPSYVPVQPRTIGISLDTRF